MRASMEMVDHLIEIVKADNDYFAQMSRMVLQKAAGRLSDDDRYHASQLHQRCMDLRAAFTERYEEDFS